MNYDANGLGISELTFLSVNYPEIYDTVEEAINDNEEKIALDIARKAITLSNIKLI